MDIIRYPVPIDHLKFNAPLEDLEVKYGLPRKVLFCKKCVISNQRPSSTIEHKHVKTSLKKTIAFDHTGICDACLYAEKKHKDIDWERREQELVALCDRYRSRTGEYDCLVPGSGGKDSFYAAHLLKYKYGMHPLTVTWAPHIYTEWGWKNFQSWIHAGFDNYLMTPNGQIHRLLTRLAVENLLHPFQAFIFGQKNLAPKLATLFNIPLIFYGENESEYGNPIEDANVAQRAWDYFSRASDEEVYIGGVSVADLKLYFGLEPQDLLPYLPTDPSILKEKGVQVHYLGYYLKWHPQSCYYYAVEQGGFQAAPERTPGTYSKYNSIDDRIDDFHYYTTMTKFGIGRATYDAAQEIRSQDISREEGLQLVKRFDMEYPTRFEKQIFDYLSLPEKEFPVASKMFEQPMMDGDYFSLLCDQFRSPHLWKYENKTWQLRHTVYQEEHAYEENTDHTSA